jgi:hypothetical protein
MHRKIAAVMTAIVASGALFLGVRAWGSASSAAPPKHTFVKKIDNPMYPLVPGTVFLYRGVRDGQTQVDRVTVTHRTKVIQGVTTRVVRDVARHQGRLLEKTEDWYAQDAEGNVWYFGEDTAEYGPGGNVVRREGSWEAGVHGAIAGIIMKAHPLPPAGYRQEYLAGHAEDTAWVLRRGGSLDLPYGRVDHILTTMEWTRLEPTVVDKKFYAAGVGLVLERSVAGDHEIARLVAILHR